MELTTIEVGRRAASWGVRAAGWVRFVRVLRWGGAAGLAICVGVFVVAARRWPVVNDAALMHYVVLLQRQGWAPYREIKDINFPGAYLPDWVAMWAAGDAPNWVGDLLWRGYDLVLLGVAALAMVVIAWPVDWFAGVFAGGLFALFHGRDGVGQAGQRDLAIAVLLLVAGAAALVAERASPGAVTEAKMTLGRRDDGRLRWWLLGLSGLALGAASTIKPFGAAYFVCLLVWSWRRWGRAAVAVAVGGFSTPLLLAWLFLWRAHAAEDFLAMCLGPLRLHAGLGRLPLGAILVAARPMSFVKLAAVGVGLLALQRSWRRLEVRLALVGLGLGAASFFVQGKGYSYQRYPYVAFLLLWVGLECAAAMRDRRWGVRALGAGGLLFGMCLCAPGYLRAALRAGWEEPYLLAMEQDLQAVAGAGGVRSLDGQVQCVDSISGCVSVLYRLRLRQATGAVYDEFLFPPEGPAGEVAPQAVRAGQEEFLSELRRQPPGVLIVSAWLFPEGPGGYRKVASWPAFAEFVQERYRLVDERAFARSENGPLGFRMYVLRSWPAATRLGP